MESFTTPTGRQTNDRCVPFVYPWLATKRAYSFSPNLTIVHGQLLIASATNTNDVQTATVTGTPTVGNQAIAFTNPLTGDIQTGTFLFNSTLAQAQAVVSALPGFAGNMTVGGGPWPGTPLTFTGAGAFLARLIPVATVGTSTLNAGATTAVAHTTPGATANMALAYAGSGSPIGISEFDVATDANGGITFGSANTGMSFGETYGQAPVWNGGRFLVADLTGVDANAVTVLGRCDPPLGQAGAVLHID